MQKRTDTTTDSVAIKEVYELQRIEEKYKKVKADYEAKKKKLTTSIRNYMFSNGWKNFSFENKEKNEVVSVVGVTQKRIAWNAEKLEENLDKEICNEIIQKVYTINNIQGLIKYLKSCGVDAKKFKKFINVEKKVDGKKINELSETGEISLKDIQGCYELKESEGFVRINVKELDE